MRIMVASLYRQSGVIAVWVGRDLKCCFFQAEDGIRGLVRSRGLGDVYKRQHMDRLKALAEEARVAAEAGGEDGDRAARALIDAQPDADPEDVRKEYLHAEVLALATLAQLVRPGTPLIYGMSSSVPNMRSGANLSGAVEIGMMGTALAQLARRCGLPCVLSSGTDAHHPGAQSILERLMTLLPPALASVDLINLTTLDTKMSFSLEQLVLDDMVLGLVARYLRGIAVDDEALALDIIDELGPGGGYATAGHTVRHFRSELHVPGLLERGPRAAWEAAGAHDLREDARALARRILAEHRPTPLADGVAACLDDIVAEVEREGS
mgnify:CR=1 FL=1